MSLIICNPLQLVILIIWAGKFVCSYLFDHLYPFLFQVIWVIHRSPVSEERGFWICCLRREARQLLFLGDQGSWQRTPPARQSCSWEARWPGRDCSSSPVLLQRTAPACQSCSWEIRGPLRRSGIWLYVFPLPAPNLSHVTRTFLRWVCSWRLHNDIQKVTSHLLSFFFVLCFVFFFIFFFI